MSGPKRGTWHIVYDPTPTRLADLGRFAQGQVGWLDRHGSFIRRYLGEEAMARACGALECVQASIDAGDPDSGFDAYGIAWNLLNQLRSDAETRCKERREQEARHQQAAASCAEACKAAWQDPENQALLARWASAAERQRLEAELRSVPVGSPEHVQFKARTWQESLSQALATAAQQAEENAKALKACLPELQAAIQLLGGLNISVLTEAQQQHFRESKARIEQEAEEALAREDLQSLRSAIGRLKGFASEQEPKVKAAELEKASRVWRDALARCGYSVVSRRGPDGAIILQASSFPMKSLNVEVRPDTQEVRLDVNGKHDHTPCVKDVQSLQVELARQGVQLTMTDWGGGKPGGVEHQLMQRTSIAGAK